MSTKRLRHHPPPSPESMPKTTNNYRKSAATKAARSCKLVLGNARLERPRLVLSHHIPFSVPQTYRFVSFSEAYEPLPIAMSNQFFNDVSCRHLNTRHNGPMCSCLHREHGPIEEGPNTAQNRSHVLLPLLHNSMESRNPTESPSADQNLKTINLRSPDILRGMRCCLHVSSGPFGRAPKRRYDEDVTV